MLSLIVSLGVFGGDRRVWLVISGILIGSESPGMLALIIQVQMWSKKINASDWKIFYVSLIRLTAPWFWQSGGIVMNISWFRIGKIGMEVRHISAILITKTFSEREEF